MHWTMQTALNMTQYSILYFVGCDLYVYCAFLELGIGFHLCNNE